MCERKRKGGRRSKKRRQEKWRGKERGTERNTLWSLQVCQLIFSICIHWQVVNLTLWIDLIDTLGPKGFSHLFKCIEDIYVSLLKEKWRDVSWFMDCQLCGEWHERTLTHSSERATTADIVRLIMSRQVPVRHLLDARICERFSGAQCPDENNTDPR